MYVNKLTIVKTIIILGCFFWLLPAQADEVTSTIDIATSTPEITTSTIETPTTITNTTTDSTPIPTSALVIRYQDQIVWSGSVNLTPTIYHDEINELNYTLATPTVFSALVLADQQSDSFNISDAQYNESFSSFYLACIKIVSPDQNACYNWNYVVNNTYPSVGMDSYSLTGGETIYIYFSNPWQITATTTTFPLDTTTTLQTWLYQFDNLPEPWILDGNSLIDISVPNPTPTGWWDQTITVTTTETNASGTVDFVFSATGTYFAKITSLDFSKWSNPITLTVQEVISPTTTQPTTTTDPQLPTGSGGGSDTTPPAPIAGSNEINNAVQKILNFLKSKQLENGGIIDLQTSDWSAMSFGANNIYANEIINQSLSLYDYLNNTLITSDTGTLNYCTEYPRHILGLLAGGTGKTNTQVVDLKNKIKTECLTNNQVGQAGINDDIFIILSLLATDENPSSEIIQTAINTIKLDQQTDGSFTWNGWPGQDVTGASINALKYASRFGITIDSSIFDKAKSYLRTTQLDDGGWGFGNSSDPLTTAWAIYGLNSLQEGQAQWTSPQGKNPWTVLTSQLTNNGYYTSPWSADGIDWFATKHAVPALLGKSWPIILTPLPTTQNTASSVSSGSLATPSTSTETTSIITPTSTPTTTPILVIIQTSTPENPTSTGEILGEKITKEKEEEAIKPIVNKPKKLIAKKTLVAVENKTTLTTQTEPERIESVVSEELEATNNPSRSIVKIILIVSGAGALVVGIYLSLKSFKK